MVSMPLGSAAASELCLRQKEHWQARISMSQGAIAVSKDSTTLPQWHPPL
jgi:hypothetical protein